jgi:uncharacterized membrane protein YheB (UPF0754 family)
MSAFNKLKLYIYPYQNNYINATLNQELNTAYSEKVFNISKKDMTIDKYKDLLDRLKYMIELSNLHDDIMKNGPSSLSSKPMNKFSGGCKTRKRQ